MRNVDGERKSNSNDIWCDIEHIWCSTYNNNRLECVSLCSLKYAKISCRSKKITFLKGSTVIGLISSNLKIYEHIEILSYLFLSIINEDDHLISQNSEIMGIISLYITCRFFEYPCTLKEILNAHKEEINISYFNSHNKIVLNYFDFNLPRENPFVFLKKYLDKLEFSEEGNEKAFYMLNQLIESGYLRGKRVSSVLGAIIYLISNDYFSRNRISQKVIADALFISEVTIRKNYKEIQKIIKNSNDIIENRNSYINSDTVDFEILRIILELLKNDNDKLRYEVSENLKIVGNKNAIKKFLLCFSS